MRLRRWLAAEVLLAVFAPEDTALESAPAHDGGLVSTNEIAEAIGIAPSALGRRAAHLKTPLHGEWRHAIGEFSGKVVQQWLWNDAGRAAVLAQFGGRDTSAVIGSSARSRRTH
jgi:hypothetical protein